MATFGRALERAKIKATIGGGKSRSSSSSTDSSAQFEKCVLICARSAVRAKGEKWRKMEWYVLNLSSRDCKKKKRKRGGRSVESIPRLAWIWDSNFPLESCSAAVGSTIFNVGGHPHRISSFIPDVRVADTRYPEKGWKSGTPMLNGRAFAKAVALSGKLYVFGGSEPDSLITDPWAEVFDPEKDEWKALKKPPSYLPLCGLFVAVLDHVSKKILVCSGREPGLYVYDAANDDWETIDDKFGLLSHSEPVLVKDTLYWVWDERVYTYDLYLKESFSGRIKCRQLESILGIAGYLDYFPLFIHLRGEEFCFLWLDNSRRPPVRCAIVRVQKRESGRSLKVKTVSNQAYSVDHKLGSIVDGLLLDDGMFSGLKKLEAKAHLEMLEERS